MTYSKGYILGYRQGFVHGAVVVLVIALIIFGVFALCHAQTPAPEPAVDNLIQENWKNRQGIFVELTDSTSAVDNQIIAGECSKAGESASKADWDGSIPSVRALVELWQQYKAEFKPTVWRESMFFDSTGHIEYQHELTEPTAEGFLDWLEGRVK